MYVETSIISALVTDRSDMVSLYRRRVAEDWWETQRPRYDVLISSEVLRQLSDPALPEREAALRVARGIPLLEIDDTTIGLSRILIRENAASDLIPGDSLHVALACLRACDFLLTWEIRRLANARSVARLGETCLRLGLVPPRMVTPDVLWEEDNDDGSALCRPDPLIDEVRAIRAAISARCGNDIGRLCDHLRDFERQHAERRSRPSGESQPPP